MGDEPLRLELTLGDPSQEGWRLDRFLAAQQDLFSRSQGRQRIIETRVNGRPAKLSRRLRIGDRVELLYRAPPRSELCAEQIPLDIVYEDRSVVVINKPQGLVVHPACGHYSGTLVNGLLWHFGELREAFGQDDPRPGIVHRLDKDTSGVMIVAKDPATHAFLAGQFKERQVRKLYLAIVHGCPREPEGRVETLIARDPRSRKRFAVVEGQGKPAATTYRVLRSSGGYSLVLFRPRTGRTHQIRLHARHLGCPVVGDPLYGRRQPEGSLAPPGWTLMLHAARLRLTLPGEDAPRMFSAPIPARFRDFLRGASSRETKSG